LDDLPISAYAPQYFCAHHRLSPTLHQVPRNAHYLSLHTKSCQSPNPPRPESQSIPESSQVSISLLNGIRRMKAGKTGLRLYGSTPTGSTEHIGIIRWRRINKSAFSALRPQSHLLSMGPMNGCAMISRMQAKQQMENPCHRTILLGTRSQVELALQ
ncbi:hypothetical protein BCR39DRAFT_576615, partial [Naematelia encephala]